MGWRLHCRAIPFAPAKAYRLRREVPTDHDFPCRYGERPIFRGIVPNWPRADPNLDQTSVFASTKRFEINLLALKYALEPSSWRIVRGIGSEKAKRLTNRFGRCVAVELLSGRVPRLNSCARIDAEN